LIMKILLLFFAALIVMISFQEKKDSPEEIGQELKKSNLYNGVFVQQLPGSPFIFGLVNDGNNKKELFSEGVWINTEYTMLNGRKFLYAEGNSGLNHGQIAGFVPSTESDYTSSTWSRFMSLFFYPHAIEEE
jgi:hypothetical protein